MFSRACHPLHFSHWVAGWHVFPHLPPVIFFPTGRRLPCFPVLATGYIISHWVAGCHVYPCLPPVTLFPTGSPVGMFSRAGRRLQVFLCPPLVHLFLLKALKCSFIGFRFKAVNIWYDWISRLEMFTHRVIMTSLRTTDFSISCIIFSCCLISWE